MTAKPALSPVNLKTIVVEALHIYEQAQIEHRRWQQQSAAAQQSQQRAQANERSQAEQRAPAETGQPQAEAGQERLGHLLALNQEVLQSASDLLEKAGLAHVLGAPVTPDGSAARTDQAPEQAAAAFRAAQLAHADLRLALYHLAQAGLEQEQWEAVRRWCQPLLKDAQAPLSAEARILVCETYFQQAKQVLQQIKEGEAKPGEEDSKMRAWRQDKLGEIEQLARQCLQFNPQHTGALKVVNKLEDLRMKEQEATRSRGNPRRSW